MIELAIIAVLLQHNAWEEYSQVLDWPALKESSKELYKILLAVRAWHTSNTTDLNIDELSMYFATQYRGMKEKEMEVYIDIFEKIKAQNVRQELVCTYLTQFKDKQIRQRIAEKAIDETKYTNEEVIAEVARLSAPKAEEVQVDEYVTTDIEELITLDESNPGLMWRLECLNKSIGPLRKGMFGTIMARVETGKTAMWVSEVTNFVDQIADDEHVVVFFNEENGTDVMWRLYSALTGLTSVEIESNPKAAKTKFYDMGGTKIKFVDRASLYANYMSKQLDKLNPRIIVIDNLDKVKGFDSARKTERLGAVYQWAREMAKTRAPVIGVSQASESGANKRWLTEEDMAESKTDKPAELDFLIAIGRIDRAGYEYTRFINIPKNKRRGNRYTEEKDRHGKYTITIVPELSRYKEN